MAQRTKYRDGDSIIEVTEECPKGFKGVIFLAYRDGEEIAITVDQIRKLEKVEDTPVVEPEPEPEPEPEASRPQTPRQQVELTIDFTPSNKAKTWIGAWLALTAFYFVLYTIWDMIQ